MPQIALLDSGTSFIAHQFQDVIFAASVARVDMYELSKTALFSFQGMLIPGSVDQEWLHRHADIIHAFLNEGKVVIFSGAIVRPWLPGTGNFVPKPICSFRDYALRIVNTDGIFDRVTAQDLTFQKGVAGFFARGYHPLPAKAEVLVTFESGEPVVYVDRSSTCGTILVHAGNDLWGFGWEGASSQRILPQLLEWVNTEYLALGNGRSTR